HYIEIWHERPFLLQQEQRCPDREKRSGQHGAYLDETLGLGVAMRRELLFARRDDVLFFMNNIGYIFIVRRLGKQSKLILSQSDSISNLKLNLKIWPMWPKRSRRSRFTI